MLPKCCLCPVQKRNQPIKDISCKTVCGFHLLDDHCPFTRRGCNVPGATEEEAEAHCWERHRQEAWRWIWSWASKTWKWGQGEPCVGLAGQDPQSVEAASSCCRQQLCSLSDPPYALPPIPKDGKGIIILREHCAKIFFFFLEFLERLLDSSKYSFKSHWSICYSATVIAAGGGRFLTRCTHARTHTEARDCHLPMSRPGGSSCLEPVPYNLKLRFMTNFTKSLKDDAPSLTGLLSLKFNDPVRTVNWDEAVYFFIPNHYFTDTRLRTWFVHEIRLFLTL